MKKNTILLAAIGFYIIGGTKQEYLTYNAAVVEYHPSSYSSSNEKEYISLLRNVSDELDLIIFPESTLSVFPTAVPNDEDEILCNSTKYPDFLKELSCAAIERNVTIVVNLNEDENCTDNNSTGFCPSSGIVQYNSDVVFNPNGGVSAKYRKWNLFGERGRSRPVSVELPLIKIKNITFGMFTCFDILFYQPPLELTKKLNVKNIIFPSMWFSELPFLTAKQVQHMWAVENDVVLLAAGANNPEVGSGGTGIYLGSDGPLTMETIALGGSKVFVQSVPNLEIENNPNKNVALQEEDTDAIAKDMDGFYLKTDPSVKEYNTVVLNTNKTEIFEEVCHGTTEKTCCQFSIRITVDETLITKEEKNQYTYHLGAFNGVRSFDGVKNGGIEACTVTACLNESVASCGKRFDNYSDIVWPITFESINTTASFINNEDRIQFPNSLLSSIRPISPKLTTWSKEVTETTVTRSHILNKSQNRLLTFGIYGRDFSRDSDPEESDLEVNKDGKNFGNSLKTSFVLVFVLISVFCH